MHNSTKTTWRKVKLGEVASKITKGTTPTTLGKRFTLSGINFIKAESITDDGRFIPSKFEHIDQETNEILKRSKVQENDILYSIAGVICRPAFVNKEILPANTNQALAIIRINLDKAEPKYVYYFLSSKRQRIYSNNLVAQSAQPNINLEQVSGFEFEIPNLDTQKRIADILSAFDDKIELNNKISKNLEQTVQAIFKEWFVNFKFPGYEKVKMFDSELGKIPKGWEVKKIKDAVKIQKGLSYSSSEISDKATGIPMLNLANFLRGGGFNSSGIKYYSGRYKETDLVQSGDIIIAMTDLTSNREVVGHPARVPSYSHWDKIIISLDVCAIKTEEVLKDFLYYLMMRKDFSFRMASSAGGTNIAHLSKATIEDYIFVLPDRDLLKQFHNFVDPIIVSKNKYEVENQKLAAVRDLLLPKLISGEI